MDLRSRLSAGARRVVEDALRLARKAEDLTGGHLIWAMWVDESRAADILSRAGTTAEILAAVFGTPERGATPGNPDAAPEYPRTVLFRAIVDEAHRHAVEEATGSEILTEHLLRAVISTDKDLSRRLEQEGVRIGDLHAPFAIQEERTASPLETEVRLRTYQPPVTERVTQLRLLDAAFNRCREGLRVLEDYVRFTRDDPRLTSLIKEIRHRLVPLSKRLGVDDALSARDTARDVGTAIHTGSEISKESIVDVLRANARRVQESLRSIEEFAKLSDTEVAANVGQLRYDAYTLERTLLAAAGRAERLAQSRLYLLVTDRLCPGGMGETIDSAIAGGVDVVQLREKNLPERRLLELARYVRDWTAEREVLFIMNDRPDIAALVHADGLHLGQDDLSVDDARRIVGSEMLIGVSTHHIDQARQAVLDGADYLGVGPCFPSQTKSFEDFPGMEYVRQVAAEIRLPWFAIGGISRETLPALLAAGGRRAAVSNAICAAESPADAAQELRTILDSAPLP